MAASTAAQSIYNSVNGSSLSSPPYGVTDYGSTEARSGIGHFTPSGGTVSYNMPTTAPTNAPPALTAPPPTLDYAPTGSTPTYGSESGPGLLDQWFNERATGTDPGYEYETNRGLKALDNEYAARGGYNSGAATQADSDYLANMGAKREGQLDSLASGASGERQNSLSTMLGFGTGITSGMAGLTGNYDLGAANALNTGNAAALQLGTNAATAPYLANQGMMQNLTGLGTLALLGL